MLEKNMHTMPSILFSQEKNKRLLCSSELHTLSITHRFILYDWKLATQKENSDNNEGLESWLSG